MKICASTYSFGHYRAKGIDFMIEKAAELGFDGIEIVEGTFDGSADVKVAEEVRKKCEEKGLSVASLCTGADLLYGEPAEQTKRLCALADVTAAYGAPVMRHDVCYGFRGEKTHRSYSDAVKKLAPVCLDVTKYAESVGVVTCTENHGFFSQDSARVEQLINAVGHDNFGALVDIGNFMCADEDPNFAVGVMAGYARHVHAKDFYLKSGSETDPGAGWFRTRAGNYLKGTVIGHGDARAAQSLGILKRSGYDGWISVEFEGMEDNLTGLKLGAENTARFWGMF
jgi:sugar phosphate isomerase/epimerase